MDSHSKKWSVYIVQCADGTFYTGVTTDVKRRIKEHNSGMGSKYTRARLPVVLSHKERATSRSKAQMREAEIKKLTRIQKEKLMKRSE